MERLTPIPVGYRPCECRRCACSEEGPCLYPVLISVRSRRCEECGRICAYEDRLDREAARSGG